MLDKYWFGDINRMSPEAPVPVLLKKNITYSPGGAANVARNIHHAGINVNLIGFIGKDDSGSKLKRIIGIKFKKNLIELNNFQTTVKNRIISPKGQILRIDEEENLSDKNLSKIDLTKKISDIKNQVVVISDYGKGAIDLKWTKRKNLVSFLSENNKVIVDPKGQDFRKYKKCFMLTPNLTEFENIVGRSNSEKQLELKALKLRQDLNIRNLLVTRGADGLSLFNDKGVNHIKSKKTNAIDVTGAGDIVVSHTAIFLAKGLDLIESIKKANHAAGLSVQELGTVVIKSS